jgi:hypothetical protein
MIRQFKDAVTTHFEASKDVTPAISAREYSDFQEEGRRLKDQFIRLERELLGIFDSAFCDQSQRRRALSCFASRHRTPLVSVHSD